MTISQHWEQLYTTCASQILILVSLRETTIYRARFSFPLTLVSFHMVTQQGYQGHGCPSSYCLYVQYTINTHTDGINNLHEIFFPLKYLNVGENKGVVTSCLCCQQAPQSTTLVN